MSDSAVKALIGLIIGILGAAAVIKIIDDATKERKYVCPQCGHVLRHGTARCPACKTPLRWA
jgi:lipopolysaccharide biosynthesis regulator YciM